MKKLLLYILTLIYLVSTTGAMLETHFCMGKVAGWSIGHSQSDTCGRCGMEKSSEQDNGCCNDESTFVKNTADQKPGGPGETPVPFCQGTESAAIASPHPGFISKLSAKPKGDVHLRSSNTPLHILLSVFRI